MLLLLPLIAGAPDELSEPSGTLADPGGTFRESVGPPETPTGASVVPGIADGEVENEATDVGARTVALGDLIRDNV